jgi:hypothetical protein
MGRNRVVGSPCQPLTVTAEALTTEYWVDRYLIDAVPCAVTLDPNAVQGDQVVIKDVSGSAATHNITITASEGQAIIGASGSVSITTNYGAVQLTFDEGLAAWDAVFLSGTPIVTPPSAPALAHAWADSPGTSPVSSVAYVVIAQATITPNKYGNIRVIGTGVVENTSLSTNGLFFAAVGVAVSPGTPVEVYTGDDNGLGVPHEATEVILGAGVAISYTITGLTPGVAYNVAIMGQASSSGTIVVNDHGIQLDAEEVSE